MARINLLPWRTERRKLREREFYMLLAAAAVGGLLALFGLIGWMSARIDNQTQRNTYLTNEIKGLDKQIEEIKELDKTKSQLLTRKQIIEQLQSNRSQMVHLFDEMVKTVPDGVRLSSLKQAGDVLTLEGVAESNARVASYMRNIDNSPWMGRTDLRKIENKAGTKDFDKKMPYVFSLDVKLTKPEDAQNEKGIANGDPAATGTATMTEAPAGDTAAAPPPAADLGGQVTDAATQLATKPATAPTSPATAKDAEKGEKK
ncbi:MAG: PilN domain-containing protein [Rhodanobacteraceae bacterium]